MRGVILAVDQGTTGTTCLVVGDELEVVGRGYAVVGLSTPQPGWVEQDPRELWESVEAAAAAALADAGLRATELDAVGIANQRETTIVWERESGEPVHPGDRLAGPADRGTVPGAPGRRDPVAHRAHARSVLLGDEARVDPAAPTRRPKGSPSAPSTRGCCGS